MSISFKQFISEEFIAEGGNVKIKGQLPESVDLSKHDRNEVVKAFKKSITKLNGQFKLDKGLNLWKPSTLAGDKIFSGSTKHLFNSEIEENKLKKHKSVFGDFDLMIDIEMLDQLREFLQDNEGKTFENLELIGSKAAGDQQISLWKFLKFDIRIQIDFEGVEFKNFEPTEWSNFSHSSPFEDTVNGIKGVFHKLLMTSLMAPKKVEAIEQMKTKQKEIFSGTHALSIKGLREKYKKVGEQDGKPVFVDTKSKDFVTDFIDIFQEVFGKKPTDVDIKKFWSFKGMIELIKKYCDDKERETIVESFIEKLFGKTAQGLYRGDNNRDLEEKMVALHFLEEKLDVDIHKDKLTDMQDVYYKRNK
jgi:hypothetical protein